MAGPLSGVKVLEFSEIIAGPFCGMLLADMGADVIKVEPPWGEPWRFAQEFIPAESRQYMSLNRGKRCLTLNMRKPEAREIVYKLVPSMDVVIVNSRPDVPANLGIDYETLSAINPRLVYCDNTAFGRKGPHRHRPGYDIIAQAMSGLMASGGWAENGVPKQLRATAVADYSAGLSMAWGVCAALFCRERTGLGQKIETTLLGAAVAVQGGRFIEVDVVDLERRTKFLDVIAEMRARGAAYEDMLAKHQELSGWRTQPYYRPYRAKDGVLTVGCLSDPLRKRMAVALGLEDPRFQPGYDPSSEGAIRSQEEVTRCAEAVFLEKTVAEWLKLLDEAGVPAGPVNFVEELVRDEQMIANDLVVDLEHTLAGHMKMVGPHIKMDKTPLEARCASPALGEHSAEVLGDLGYTAEEVQALREKGVTS